MANPESEYAQLEQQNIQIPPTSSRRAFIRDGALLAGEAIGLALLGKYSPHLEQPSLPEINNYSEAAQYSYYILNTLHGSEGTFYENSNSTKLATNWTYSRIVQATLDMHMLLHTSATFQAVQNQIHDFDMYKAPPVPDSPPLTALPINSFEFNKNLRFYDDNAWDALDYLQAYHINQDPNLLSSSENIFWATVENYQQNGGIVWESPGNNSHPQQKNTVSAAPAIEIGVQLYQLTGDDKYLHWSELFHDYVDREFYDATTGLYNDHVDKQRNVDTTKWSYNQGSMIGANILLAQATGKTEYLLQAEQVARASLQYFSGKVLEEQTPKFNAIYFRNLMFLPAHTKDLQLKKDIDKSLSDYCDTLKKQMILIPAGPEIFNRRGFIETIEQASAVQLFALHAADPSKYAELF